ncbi:hypothetical protein [Verrucomicrobium spinosum]|uniref:hypothetical protein n=1 Tax=Verrucomicrobium spinosum TaxID=2736 RepID=UPI0009461BC4|nr:hypothetical protein [Verrucomicrobium spinosum]
MKSWPCNLVAGTLLLISGACNVCVAQVPEFYYTAETESMLRLQVFLDRAGYGPGKIDGKGGLFTQTAREIYERVHGPVPRQEPEVDATTASVGPEGSSASHTMW